MTETTNYKLRKPSQDDFYNVEDFNYNADKIDEALKNKVDKDGSNATGTWDINVTGNAKTATNATNDSSGNKIEDTYSTKREVSGLEIGKKANSDSPVFTNSVSMGRMSGSTVGKNSTALGSDTTASGLYSHAEGHYTTASRDSSHAEGCKTNAIGDGSHAEGYNTTASGSSSHAEGSNVYNGSQLSDRTVLTVNGEIITVSGSTAYKNASHAEGCQTLASGESSHAEGFQTHASGENSHAEGSVTFAQGDNSHAEGGWTAAEGSSSHAEGGGTFAKGDNSHAEGTSTTADGVASHAEGNRTTASGIASHAEGYNTTASGDYSHAEGHYTTASGDYSHAGGKSTTALGSQYVIGHANMTRDAGEQAGTSGTAFIIGNGSSTAKPANAFRVDYNGNVYSAYGTISTGADYAEYFEWADQNPNKEDRVGLFVTLDEDNPEMIRLAKEGDYILGIVSGMPSVIGNGDEDWRGRYILDDFGRYIEETFEYEIKKIDKATGEIVIVTETGTKWKENPDYDPEQQYIQRSNRPEWDAIGMVGVLSVYDDGTCKVNGYCKCSKDGVATASETGYRVIKRVSDNIVKVVLK